MADPLSISASVTSLVALGLQTTEYLYKYYATYRDRDKDLARTTKQLDDLLESLRIINDIVQTRVWRPNEGHILKHIEGSISRCDDVISELQDEARKCQKVPVNALTGSIREIGRRAAYPFRESTLKKLDEDIRDFRDNLSMALQTLELKEHSKTRDDIQELKQIVQNAQAQHLANSIRDWLRAPDVSINFNAACNKRHAGTGQWFIRSNVFTTWLEQDNSFRWLHGFAGCGKSILCATAIQHTFRYQSSHAGSAVAFFFFAFDDKSKQDASSMLRALLSQLSGQISGLDRDLAQLQVSCNNSIPPVSVLMQYLRQTITRASRVYILLDALDECPVDSTRAEVLSALQTMREWSLSGLHLLVTSRNVPDIRDSLLFCKDSQSQDYVALETDCVQEDIRQYVSYQVDHDPQLLRWGKHRERIKESLTQRAKGVFRWVDCQLHPLRHCACSVRYLERCLSTLPSSLDATYERMLRGIGDESQSDAQRILSLLCLSPRPLSVDEVIEALTVDLDMNCYDNDRKLQSADDLCRICPGLVEVVLSAHKIYDIHSESESKVNRTDVANVLVLRIAHFSVHEYLVSDRIKQSPVRSFAVSESAHLQISKTCLLYLSNPNFLRQSFTPNMIQQFPLAQFAAQYWHYHYRQIDSELAKQLTGRLVVLMTSENSLDYWIRLYDPDQDWARISYDEIDLSPPIYYASLLGLDLVVADMLPISEVQVNAVGPFGNALHAASMRGHEKIVQTLLMAGADVNAQGGRSGSALCAASINGHEKIVQTLLMAGADVNAQDERFGSALFAASMRGHEKIVQALLMVGADVNARGEYYGNALCAASTRGHEKIVQTLLMAGASVNARGGVYGNALCAASMYGHEKAVKILLEAGADVNAKGRGDNSALLHARGYQRSKLSKNIVQMLLEAGAEDGDAAEDEAEVPS